MGNGNGLSDDQLTRCQPVGVRQSRPARSSEHRAAPASPPVYLDLVATNAETTHLEVVAELREEKRRGLEEQISDILLQGTVMTRAKLRDSLAVQNERLGVSLG